VPRYHHRAAPIALEEHLRRIRSEFPDIRPFEEDDDVNWWNDGLNALETNQLQ
jgi:hypothetical protein